MTARRISFRALSVWVSAIATEIVFVRICLRTIADPRAPVSSSILMSIGCWCVLALVCAVVGFFVETVFPRVQNDGAGR